MTRIRRFFFKIFAAVVLLGVPAGLILLQTVGVGAGWRDALAERLSSEAFRVTLEKLTFDPFAGIVAEGAEIFRRGEPELRVARIGRLALSPNLSALLARKFTIDSLDVEQAELAIPFADDGGDPSVIRIANVSAGVVNSPGQVRISHAEFVLEGVRFSVEGQLLNPGDFRAGDGPPKEADPGRVAAIRAVLRILKEIDFGGVIPEVRTVVGGDLADLETLHASSVNLRAGPVRYRELAFDRVELDGEYHAGTAEVFRLEAAGASGDLRASGRWQMSTGAGRMQVTGRVDAGAILAFAGQTEAQKLVEFVDQPEIDAEATMSRTDEGIEVKVTGDLVAGAFRVKDVAAERLTASFTWQGPRLYVQDLLLKLQTGELRANVLSAPGDFRIQLESGAVPTEIVSLLGPKERELIEQMEFRDPPSVAVSLSGPKPDFKALSGTGRMEIGRTAMRGAWMDFGTADLVFADQAVRYDNITLGRGEQRGSGSFTYDFGRQLVRLEKIVSNLMPVDVLLWVDPRVAKTVSDYRFRGPPNATADGVIYMKEPDKNGLAVEVSAPAGVDYDLLNRTLRFGATQATVKFRGQEVVADVTRAALYGGNVSVKATISSDPKNPVFSTDLRLDRIDFPALTKLYFGYERSKGVVSGSYAFKARMRDEASMVGTGAIRVEDGHVLAIPVFGPLSDIISTIIPGAGHESARLATADFTIARQRITTSNLEIQGAGFTLYGEGDVAFPSGALDLAVRINARGLPGLVLFPVSKLFEYVSTGTVSEPEWRPKLVPREFLDVLGGVGGVVGDAVGGVGNAVGGVGEAVGGVGDAIGGTNGGGGSNGGSNGSGGSGSGVKPGRKR